MDTKQRGRHRRAFRYQDDPDSTEPVDGIDEQEQEQVIERLCQQDQRTTSLYRNIFQALPLLSSLASVHRLVRHGAVLPGGLAITALLATSYILHALPAQQHHQLVSEAEMDGLCRRHHHHHPALARPGKTDRSTGPLRIYLIPLTGLLSCLLAIGGWKDMSKHIGSQDAVYAMLPLAVFLIIMFVRSQLQPVDVQELSGLRYDYKGA